MSRYQIQLKPSCIFNVPLQNYEKDFTFIINGEEFQTSRIISDLLSQNISNQHKNDPTLGKFFINTKSRGNFSTFLKLANFSNETVSEDELPFVTEIIEKLGTDSIKLNGLNNSNEISTKNVFQLITNHEKFGLLYTDQINSEIDFIASHFYELFETEENLEELYKLSIDVVYRILNSPSLQLTDEDQVVKIINNFYKWSNEYSILYELVKFENVTVGMIDEFIELFDNNEMTTQTWKQISIRLKKELKNESNELTTRYKTQKYKGKTFLYSNESKMNGIINFLNEESNNNIDEKINFTASGLNRGSDENYFPRTVALHNDHRKYFISKDALNSWICLDFKDKKVIPTEYSIRSAQSDSNFMRNWNFEGSNDNIYWTILDEQKNCQYFKSNGCIHTFKINKQLCTEFKYIRIRQTGPNYQNQNYLIFDSLEIYGTLIWNKVI